MKYYEGLPIFELTLDNADGLQYISIVDKPAIKSTFLCFSEDVKEQFSIQDEEKHIISGLVLIPDLPIFRKKDNRGYYVKFSKNTIEQLVEKFFNEQKTLSINVDHSIPVDNVVIIESYFINHERGISPKEFANYPDGSWYISMKVNDDDLWQHIKNGQLNGFSVEGLFELVELSDVSDIEIPDVPQIKVVDIKQPTESLWDVIARYLD